MLHVKALQVNFGLQSVLQNISFGLNAGEVLAITGANGAGKSTLLKCITGMMAPTAGEIQRQKWLYLPQNIQDYFQAEILLDNLMIYGVEETIVRQFLGAAKLRRDRVLQPVSTLSYGELMRAAIVSAILAKAEFLFLDEPTNHLDVESLEVLEQLLEDFPGGMLLISHDRQFTAQNARTILSFQASMLVPVEF